MSDVDWAFSDRDILKRYAGQVIVVRDRRVWGAGPDLDAALAAAQEQPGCPELRRLRIVVMPDEEVSFFYFPPPVPRWLPETSVDTPS